MFSGPLAFILALLLPLGGALEQRLLAWPDWSLPAPLTRPGQTDLEYPQWLEGNWLLTSTDGSQATVCFKRRSDGLVVGNRAANATAVAKLSLGDELLSVENDPNNPNRQLTRLRDGLSLETSIQGRGSKSISPIVFLADELSLQTLRRPELPPRLSRIEILSKFSRRDQNHITVEQWQARYPPPEAGLRPGAVATSSSTLLLERQTGNDFIALPSAP